MPKLLVQVTPTSDLNFNTDITDMKTDTDSGTELHHYFQSSSTHLKKPQKTKKTLMLCCEFNRAS